jgi:hypothetical protein
MERVCIFRVIWNKLQPFGIFYTYPFGNLVVIWYIFPRFGILCKEKSGNPGEIALGEICYVQSIKDVDCCIS